MTTNMTNLMKIIWRLKELPTSQSLRELVKDGILTKDEARQILFSSEAINESEKPDDKDIESLKSEIKFLRELVEKLSNNQSVKIIETIREVEKPWKQYPWYEPYRWYCSSGNSIPVSNGFDGRPSTYTQKNFSDIKTF